MVIENKERKPTEHFCSSKLSPSFFIQQLPVDLIFAAPIRKMQACGLSCHQSGLIGQSGGAPMCQKVTRSNEIIGCNESALQHRGAMWGYQSILTYICNQKLAVPVWLPGNLKGALRSCNAKQFGICRFRGIRIALPLPDPRIPRSAKSQNVLRSRIP